MKKYLILALSLLCLNTTFASGDTANIKIKISGTGGDNRYYLCMPNVGCLSILSAQRGKVYPIYHSIEMSSIFVTNLITKRVNGMGLPSSCNVTVEPGQTITINGNLQKGANDSVYINQLRCNIS